MTSRIAALTFLALPLGLGLSSSCDSVGGTVEQGAGGRGHGGAGGGGGGGDDTGGTAGTGNGGDVGGQAGSGGLGRGGSGTGRGGAAGGSTAGGQGGGAGKTGAGGRAGAVGRGGSTGQGGAKTPIDAGPVACDDITSPGRLAVYNYDSSEVSGSSIQLNFDIVNYTAFTSKLSQVTVRYWFTDEDPSSTNILEQYYVPIPTTMKFIALNPPRSKANTVLEMSFRDIPDAGVSWIETRGFNFAFHKNSYAGTYDQSNDYSYDPKLKSALGLNPKITAYLNGVLSWGCEPPVQEVVIDAGAGGEEVDAGAGTGGTGGTSGSPDVAASTPETGRRG